MNTERLYDLALKAAEAVLRTDMPEGDRARCLRHGPGDGLLIKILSAGHQRDPLFSRLFES